MERITLALFRHHGLDVNAWPDDVRALLWGDTEARVTHGIASMQTETGVAAQDAGERV
jgi:hypothetical protein